MNSFVFGFGFGLLEGNMFEKVGNGLAIVSASNGLGKDGSNIDDAETRAGLLVGRLGNGVGGSNKVEARAVEPLHGLAREHAMRYNCNNLNTNG